jgi:Ca-activated chloride channel homolog
MRPRTRLTLTLVALPCLLLITCQREEAPASSPPDEARPTPAAEKAPGVAKTAPAAAPPASPVEAKEEREAPRLGDGAGALASGDEISAGLQGAKGVGVAAGAGATMKGGIGYGKSADHKARYKKKLSAVTRSSVVQLLGSQGSAGGLGAGGIAAGASGRAGGLPMAEAPSTKEYARVKERGFVSPRAEPLSTFSIDVDTASYANTRRFLNQGRLPPRDAVRIEELLNYFPYDYPDPDGPHPFSVNTELSTAPWNRDHHLLRVGLQGSKLDLSEVPPFNLVFLMDVSGSMNNPDKLPLLKAAFKLLVQRMRPQDRVAITVYAGAAGLVLPSTPGEERERILAALDGLRAGGSTAGGAGIKLAYEIAKQHFIEGGNNRVILATDGDFNVGVSSTGALERLIEEKRETGVYLTVLGFGRGNVKDSRMETLADKGNGNYAYIDSVLEARKVLVTEMGGTLVTIAKDVKIQVEWNPARVKGYRLIGYENRALAAQDFNDDKKDAGELGAGHRVTAFYELIPAGSDEVVPGVDPLKYQAAEATASYDDWCTIKLRYKPPKENTSQLLSQPVSGEVIRLRDTSPDFRFATAVVEFGLLLQDSERKGTATYEALIARAEKTLGPDPEGYRQEFAALARAAEALSKASQPPATVGAKPGQGLSPGSPPPHPPRVQVRADAKVRLHSKLTRKGGQGKLDESAALRVVRRRTGAVKHCYERELKTKPTLAGSLLIDFTISEQGRVLKASVLENTTGDPPLDRCVVSKLKRWRFPKPEGGDASFEWKIVLSL